MGDMKKFAIQSLSLGVSELSVWILDYQPQLTKGCLDISFPWEKATDGRIGNSTHRRVSNSRSKLNELGSVPVNEDKR